MRESTKNVPSLAENSNRQVLRPQRYLILFIENFESNPHPLHCLTIGKTPCSIRNCRYDFSSNRTYCKSKREERRPGILCFDPCSVGGVLLLFSLTRHARSGLIIHTDLWRGYTGLETLGSLTGRLTILYFSRGQMVFTQTLSEEGAMVLSSILQQEIETRVIWMTVCSNSFGGARITRIYGMGSLRRLGTHYILNKIITSLTTGACTVLYI